MQQLTFLCDTAGSRIDMLLPQYCPELTRSAAQKLVESGAVLVNGVTIRKNYRSSAGDIIEVTLPAPVEAALCPQDIPLDIVYEDADVIVVNKPRGMVVHPAPGHPDGTLVNALLWHCGDSLSGIGGEKRPGIVHRIDMDTSGLLIVAKNDYAHQALSAQLENHSMFRIYECVVYGRMREDCGTIDAPIGRHPVDRKRMCVDRKNGRNAVTHWEVLARYAGFTHLRCRLETGRTHQIRVHMEHIGHPLAGDLVYGKKHSERGLSGQCLHARELEFSHPRTGRRIHLICPLPDYFLSFLSKLGPKEVEPK